MKIKYSFEQWCLDHDREKWLELWDGDKNGISPSEVSWGSEKHFYFKCSRGIHDSELKQICVLTKNRADISCKKCRSIGQWLLDNYGADGISMYWSENNTLDPFDVCYSSNKEVLFKCNIGNQHPDYPMMPGTFTGQGCRCSVCINRKIIPGINDVATTHPWTIKHFLNSVDATTVCAGSKQLMRFKCPLCGYKYERSMEKAIRFKCSCRRCGDKVSYPNKFVCMFLSQLMALKNIPFESEKTFDWSKNVGDDVKRRVYDFFIDICEPIIIEVHGEQHYLGTFRVLNKTHTLEHELENDTFKYALAIRNGILPERYVVIDARYSTQEWIRSSIMNSVLPQIFAFQESDIDWNKCEEFACSNLVKQAADLWNSGLRSARLIGEHIHKGTAAVRKYLKQGARLGWCDFNGSDLGYLSARRPILCLENNAVFDSIETCSENSENVFGFRISYGGIRNNVYGYQNSIHGLHFSLITKDKFIEVQTSTPNLAYGKVYFYENI